MLLIFNEIFIRLYRIHVKVMFLNKRVMISNLIKP